MKTSQLSEGMRYLLNSGWMLGEKCLMLAIGLATTVVLARYLGPEDFGYLNYALALLGLLNIVVHLGLSGLVVKELRSDPGNEDQILSTVFMIKVSCSVVAFIVMMSTYLIGNDQNFWVLLFTALALFFTPFEMLIDWFQARVQAKYAAVAGVVGQLGGNGLKMILAVAGAGLVYIALAHVVVVIATSALLVCYAIKLKRTYRFDFSWALATSLIKKSLLIFLGSLSAVIYLKVDQIMLQYMLGEYAVGVYSAASRLSEAWYLIPTILMASVFPKMIDLSKSDTEAYHRFMQMALDVLFLAAFTLALAVFLLSDSIVLLLYGERYRDAGAVLSIHIFAATFVFMRALFSKWIIIEEAFVFSLVTQGLGALSNVVLNYFLIRSHGVVGSAWATLISYGIAGYLSLLLSRRTRPLFVMMTRSILLHAFISVPPFIRESRRA
ncbi:flippase [Pseudomonas matsuisoli]|uniref:O-unit flippase n=1 Tax=Pseudomonas matsuisoli TaxID=1515666 RepID=A0A917PRK3_9PSED|nr:flippase [Pseudomonas matsuisoli]GGJ88522.1 O-unit flippase [Pseudomonas matsuisoli]